MQMWFSDDPVMDAERYAAEQEDQLSECPICSECDEYITDESAFYINDEWICESCMEKHRKDVC